MRQVCLRQHMLRAEQPHTDTEASTALPKAERANCVSHKMDERMSKRNPRARPRQASALPIRPIRAQPQVLAIAASTGGPSAVQSILQQLGPEFSLPILVAQHIARGFARGMVDWLNRTTPLTIQLAEHEEPLLPGHVYLAPDGQHLLAGPGIVLLLPGTSADRYCPSADRLFETVAAAYHNMAIGVVLTGMGDDGSRGFRMLHEAGSLTLAQDEASSVVYGMPRAAVAAGAVDRVEPLLNIAQAIRQEMAP